MRSMLMAILIFLALIPAQQPVQAQDSSRTHTLYVPASYDDSSAVPLIIALHPFASSGKGMQVMSGLNQLADQRTMLVAYPDSLDYTWDDGRGAVLESMEPVADVAFLTGLIGDIKAQYNISAVYVTGFAHGGSMAYRLACEASDVVDKVLTVGGPMWDHQLEFCDRDGSPVEMLIVRGGEDWFFSPTGFEAAGGMHTLTAEDTVNFWAERNGCTDSHVEDDVTRYEGCATPLTYYHPREIGHNWPHAGEYLLNTFGLDLNAVAGQFFAGEPVEFPAELSSEVYGGAPRGYTLYVPPSYDTDQPTPLVIGLHGRPHNGYGFAYLLDLNKVANQEGFIAVYPHGVNQEWNYTYGNDAYPSNGMDDVQFLRDLVDDLSVDLNIDHSRLYVTGFSNGGFMTQRVACDGSDTFAAFAIIGATLFPDLISWCANDREVPMLFFHGTQDRSVFWNGLVDQGVDILYTVPETLTFWAERNGCTPQGVEITNIPNNDDDTEVRHYFFGDCASGYPVEFYEIINGGHTIPGVHHMDEDFFGPTADDILAPKLIWEFLRQYQLN